LRLWINRIEGLIIIGEFSSEEEFYEFKDSRMTDILIIDHYEELYSDMSLIKKLSRKHRRMKILVVSMYNDLSFHNALKKCGVKGCIEKYNINTDLEDAIHNIYNGGVYFLAG
jgi:DNA-binding NarL/FixJ family response regulator